MLAVKKLLTTTALALVILVIILGAYTRLTDAGLGCPDWPGCYGQWRVPTSANELTQASSAYPHQPVDAAKAWIEMTHRYFAATLGALILGLALIALFYPRSMRPRERSLALLLLGLVIFQGLLGMWTVTLKLLPVVVMGHLLGGFSTLALLWWLWQTQHSIAQHPKPLPPLTYLRLTQLSWLTLTMLSLQIMLGAWTSANYAALSCPDFPWCQGQLWPTWQWQALNLLGASSHDQPLTFMSLEARMSIQMLHRWGAVLTTICVVTLIWQLRQIAADAKEGLSTRKHTWLLLSLLSCQIGLGITNVIAVLPLPVAVAHNGIAALLLLSVLHLLFELHHPYRNATS